MRKIPPLSLPPCALTALKGELQFGSMEAQQSAALALGNIAATRNAAVKTAPFSALSILIETFYSLPQARGYIFHALQGISPSALSRFVQQSSDGRTIETCRRACFLTFQSFYLMGGNYRVSNVTTVL